MNVDCTPPAYDNEGSRELWPNGECLNSAQKTGFSKLQSFQESAYNSDDSFKDPTCVRQKRSKH